MFQCNSRARKILRFPNTMICIFFMQRTFIRMNSIKNNLQDDLRPKPIKGEIVTGALIGGKGKWYYERKKRYGTKMGSHRIHEYGYH